MTFKKNVKQTLDFFILGLLPNINQTGIQDIDTPKEIEKDPLASLSSLKNIDLSFNKLKPPTKFKNFFNEVNLEHELNLDLE